MKTKLTKTEKLWEKGERIYDWFCAMFEISVERKAEPNP